MTSSLIVEGPVQNFYGIELVGDSVLTPEEASELNASIYEAPEEDEIVLVLEEQAALMSALDDGLEALKELSGLDPSLEGSRIALESICERVGYPTKEVGLESFSDVFDTIYESILKILKFVLTKLKELGKWLLKVVTAFYTKGSKENDNIMSTIKKSTQQSKKHIVAEVTLEEDVARYLTPSISTTIDVFEAVETWISAMQDVQYNTTNEENATSIMKYDLDSPTQGGVGMGFMIDPPFNHAVIIDRNEREGTVSYRGITLSTGLQLACTLPNMDQIRLPEDWDKFINALRVAKFGAVKLPTKPITNLTVKVNDEYLARLVKLDERLQRTLTVLNTRMTKVEKTLSALSRRVHKTRSLIKKSPYARETLRANVEVIQYVSKSFQEPLSTVVLQSARMVAAFNVFKKKAHEAYASALESEV